MPIQPDGIYIEYYCHHKTKAYWLWIHPPNSNDGFDFDYYIRKQIYDKYGHPDNVPPKELINIYLDILEATWYKNWKRVNRWIDDKSWFLKIRRDGWVLDVYEGGPNYVLTSEGPQTIKFLREVIDNWGNINPAIANKAKELLAMYVSQRL